MFASTELEFVKQFARCMGYNAPVEPCRTNCNVPPMELQPIPRTKITFTSTGEVRKPRPGEWYLHYGVIYLYDSVYLSEHEIFTRTEEQI